MTTHYHFLLARNQIWFYLPGCFSAQIPYMEWLLLLELFLYPRLILLDLFATSRRGLVRLGNCERLILSRLIHLNLIVVRKVSLRNLLLVVQMQSLHLQLLPHRVIKVLLLFCSGLTLRSILR